MKKKPTKKLAINEASPTALPPHREVTESRCLQCESLARAAISGKDEDTRSNAAEQLLEMVEEVHYWFGQVEKMGMLKERIKRAVAWPVIISLQPKDSRYHKTVVSDLQNRGLGSLALTGRNNRSGGKKGALARDWANHIHGVIYVIHGLDSLPAGHQGGNPDAPYSWDTSKVLGAMKFSVDYVVLVFPDLVTLIKSQPSVQPSEQLWRDVGVRVLYALRSNLVPQKSGRRKKGAASVDAIVRKERAAIRMAYIELANVENKSHHNEQKDGKSKKKKRRELT